MAHERGEDVSTPRRSAAYLPQQAARLLVGLLVPEGWDARGVCGRCGSIVLIGDTVDDVSSPPPGQGVDRPPASLVRPLRGAALVGAPGRPTRGGRSDLAPPSRHDRLPGSRSACGRRGDSRLHPACRRGRLGMRSCLCVLLFGRVLGRRRRRAPGRAREPASLGGATSAGGMPPNAAPDAAANRARESRCEVMAQRGDFGRPRIDSSPARAPEVPEEPLDAWPVGAAVTHADRVRLVHRVNHLLAHEEDNGEQRDRGESEHCDRERPDVRGHGCLWVILARITEAPTTPKATTPMRRKSRASGSAWHRRHHSMARARTIPPRRGMRCKVMSGAALLVDGEFSSPPRAPRRRRPHPTGSRQRSTPPCDTVAVSLPAEWIRPTGRPQRPPELGEDARRHVRHEAAAWSTAPRPSRSPRSAPVARAWPEPGHERVEHEAASLVGMERAQRARKRAEAERGEHAGNTRARRGVQRHLDRRRGRDRLAVEALGPPERLVIHHRDLEDRSRRHALDEQRPVDGELRFVRQMAGQGGRDRNDHAPGRGPRRRRRGRPHRRRPG